VKAVTSDQTSAMHVYGGCSGLELGENQKQANCEQLFPKSPWDLNVHGFPGFIFKKLSKFCISNVNKAFKEKHL
jgi:hypothetical protein